MVVSRWGKLIGMSMLAAAVLAAAQLGIVQGLGIMGGPADGTTGFASLLAVDGRRHLLTWTFFIVAASVLGGVAVGRRRIRTLRPAMPRSRGSRPARFTVAISAGLGALAAFPLVWAPIWVATGTLPSLTADPGRSIATTIAIGIGLGVLLGSLALSSRPIGISVAAALAWIWIVALASTAGTIASRGDTEVRLGMVDVPQLARFANWQVGPGIMIGVAAWLSVLVAGLGRMRGTKSWEIALSGAAGPSLVAGAYLVAGAGKQDSAGVEAYMTALVAGVAAFIVSITIAIVHRRPAAVTVRPTTPIVAVPRAIEARPVPATAYPTHPAFAPPKAIEAPRVAPSRGRAASPPLQPAAAAHGAYMAPPPPITAAAPARAARSSAAKTAAPKASSTRAPAKAAKAAPEPAKAAASTARPAAKPAPPKSPARSAAKAAPAKPSGKAARGAPALPAAPIPALPAASAPLPAVMAPAKPGPKSSRPTVIDAIPISPAPAGRPLDPKAAPAMARAESTSGKRQKPAKLSRAARREERKQRPLHKREREHIDWVQNLVNLPISPELHAPSGGRS